MDISPFGTLTEPDGTGRRSVEQVSMRSSTLGVSVHTFGATLHSVEAPDRDGRHEQVCLSLPTADDHADRRRNAYLGATCGRWANRIAGSTSEVDGRRVSVLANEGRDHLHGGPDGFSLLIWELVFDTAGDDG